MNNNRDVPGIHVSYEEAKSLFRNYLAQQKTSKKKASSNCASFKALSLGKNYTHLANNSAGSFDFDDMPVVSGSSSLRTGSSTSKTNYEIQKMDSRDAIIYTLRTFIEFDRSSFYGSYEDLVGRRNISNESFSNSPTGRSTSSNCAWKKCDKCNGAKYIKREQSGNHQRATLDFLNNQNYNHNNKIRNSAIVNEQYNPDEYNYPFSPPDYESIIFPETGETELMCDKCNGKGQLQVARDRENEKHVTSALSNRVMSSDRIKDCIYDVFVKCEDPDIPLHTLTKCKGSSILNQKAKRVGFVNHFPDENVNLACNELIARHDRKIKEKQNCQILSQSHQLLVVPITSCTIKLVSALSASTTEASTASEPSNSKSSSLFRKLASGKSSLNKSSLLSTASSFGNAKLIDFKIIGENKMVYLPSTKRSVCPIS